MYRIFKKKQPLLHHMFQKDDLVGYLERAGLVDVETAEYLLWEDIDVWIDTVETTHLHRHEIRELYYNAPADVRRVHPFGLAGWTDPGSVAMGDLFGHEASHLRSRGMDTSNVMNTLLSALNAMMVRSLVYRSGLDGLCTGSLTAPE